MDQTPTSSSAAAAAADIALAASSSSSGALAGTSSSTSFLSHQQGSRPHHQWRVLSQDVRISDVDFQRRCFHVHTELAIIAVQAGVRQLVLDLGEACYLPYEKGYEGEEISEDSQAEKDSEEFQGETEEGMEEFNNNSSSGVGEEKRGGQQKMAIRRRQGRVTVNGSSARYIHNRLRVLPEEPSLVALKTAYLRASVAHRGDLIIEIPAACEEDMSEERVLRLEIDVFVCEPSDGLNFVRVVEDPTTTTVSPEEEERGMDWEEVPAGGKMWKNSRRADVNEVGRYDHVYTYRSHPTGGSSTHHWLPCLDTDEQLAVWRFEVRVPNELTAVCCGELLDVVAELPPKRRGQMRASAGDSPTHRTFFYQLLVPTAPSNIGFAVGAFQTYADEEESDIVNYCPRPLLPLLQHTCGSGVMNRAVEFFEELLNSRFPYPAYRQVFVDQTPDELTSFASLNIISINSLYHRKILDLVQPTRQLLSLGVANQFFGCFLSQHDSSTAHWLVRALARHLSTLYVEHFFGTSEALHQQWRTLNTVCDYERRHGKIALLTPPAPPKNAMPAWLAAASAAPSSATATTSLPTSVSHHHHNAEAVHKKGQLLVGVLQRRLGREHFLKVLQRLVATGAQHSQHLMHPGEWARLLLLSMDSWLRAILNVTGKEMDNVVEQWASDQPPYGGHAHLHVQYHYNRRRNMIEVEVKQEAQPSLGRQLYVGPLVIVIQELDGVFHHTIQVDAALSKHDLPCHFKGRKQKKKKVPLSTGLEEEIDLSQIESDSPVLWVRVDPEMLLLRQVDLKQAVHQWELELRYERDVLAQLQAVQKLEHFATSHRVQKVLEEVVENGDLFFRLRQRAALSLVRVCNRLPDVMIGALSAPGAVGTSTQPAADQEGTQHPHSAPTTSKSSTASKMGAHFPLIRIFQQMFGSRSAPHIPRRNNYIATSAQLQLYHLQTTLPTAIAAIRVNAGKQCPIEVVQFLVHLLRYNDNEINRYSDDYYRASLISALGMCLTRVEHPHHHQARPLAGASSAWRPERLSAEARLVITEVTHALNYDTMRPSFQHVVGISCLQVLHKLQQLGHLPIDEALFVAFALPSATEGSPPAIYAPMRRAAFSTLVGLIHRSKSPHQLPTLQALLEFVRGGEEDRSLRHVVAEQLCARPPFINSSTQQSQHAAGRESTSTALPELYRAPSSGAISSSSPLNVKEVAEALWEVVSGCTAARDRGVRWSMVPIGSRGGGKSSSATAAAMVDGRMRTSLVELFAAMYGRETVPDVF